MFNVRAFATTATVAAALVATLGTSNAASITNTDTEERVLTITIDGIRSELPIAPGASASVCDKGCFVLFPAGDILPLTGKEKVVIKNGAGQVNGN